jgi:hypothetical protein
MRSVTSVKSEPVLISLAISSRACDARFRSFSVDMSVAITDRYLLRQVLDEAHFLPVIQGGNGEA